MASAEDPASVLEFFVNDVANLPAEITHLYEEIQAKDQSLQEYRSIINSRDASLQKFIKLHSSLVKNPKEEPYEAAIMTNYDKAVILQEEKIRLAEKAAVLLDRHVKRLDLKLRDLSTDASVPLDPNLPSLLRDSPNYVGPAASSVNTGANTPLHPLSGNTAGGAASISHAAISRITSVTAGGRVGSPSVPSAPQGNTPALASAAAAAAAGNRSAREMSVSSDTKRRRLHASLGTLPTPSSSLARQSSLGPGTPKASTPGSRAGSAGPRPNKKLIRKIPPQQPLRKKIGIRIKKSRSRVPGTNRASPSTTADDESVLSGEGTEDENVSGGGPEDAGEGDAEADEDMEDNTKYCICQRVSHGDMVACDSDNCPYQWFHWTCVGITEEPVGEWYCDHCRPLVQQKKQKKK